MMPPSNRTGSLKGNSCLKWTLFVSNVIMLACAIGMILGLLIIMVGYKEYIELLGDSATLVITVVVIFIAVIMFFIAVFGCCGVSNRNTRMLTMYIVLISALMFGLVVATIVMWSSMDNTIDNVRGNMEENMEKYKPGNIEVGGVTMVWNHIHEWYKCCGIDGMQDWADHNLSYKESQTTKYPDSCNNPNATVADGHSPVVYVDGCLKVMERSIQDNMWTIGGIVFVIVIFLLISSFLVCFQLMSIKKNDNPFYVQDQQQPFLDPQELQTMGKPYKATTVPIA